MLVSEFHYELPDDLIAQEAPVDRAGARLLRVEGVGGRLEDRMFREFPELLRADDLVVFNNTRVFPARLYGRRAPRSGVARVRTADQNPHFSQQAPEMDHPGSSPGRIEVLLTRQVDREANEWECLVRSGRKVGIGERLLFGERDELVGDVVWRGDFGERRIRFATVGGTMATETVSAEPGSATPDSPFDFAQGKLGQPLHGHPGAHEFFEIVERVGHVPLPPYIAREDAAGDRERYQTVYARERGSAAAPTAGLHFTPEILARIRDRGIETAEVTLHVGLGTFQPVRVEVVEEHRLHAENYEISEEAAEKLARARRGGRRVVAVGTTTVRTLEFAAQRDAGDVRAGAGEANLFIYPGYRFQVVGALLTNFHLPESTLLMLVCALGGKENVMRAYGHAVKERYRFYSYGDCMFVE